MNSCLFCEVARGKISSEVVYEDEWTHAFLDIRPLAKGHTVIIPKKHYPTIFEVPDKEIGPLFLALKKVAEGVAESVHADGLTMGINHKEASGQTVEHLHIHVIPRFHGDGGGSIHSVVHNPPAEPLREIGERIRSVMNKKNTQ
ncbi:MAG: HIT family protein [Candidatus Liptonbacteria bacterium]|nr:HIT family protein [Candidatus Liptonbacteria bacterium]